MIHDPFDCQMLVELVTDWLEGELPEPTRDELELHVATCAGCIAYVEQMRATRAALERLESSTWSSRSPTPVRPAGSVPSSSRLTRSAIRAVDTAAGMHLAPV